MQNQKLTRTQREMMDIAEDIYSTEERAKIESFLDLLEDWVRDTVTSYQEPESMGLNQQTEKSREALIKEIENNL